MDIKPANSAQSAYDLKGNMKVVNAQVQGDTFTKTDESSGGFFHKIGDIIKNIFTPKEKPPKEEGAWYHKPDGSGSEWHTASNPPPPKDPHGHWYIDTACGACDWYWVKDTEPAQGPE